MNADLIISLVSTVLAQTSDSINDSIITAEVDKFLSLYPAIQQERESIINHLRANFSVTSDTYQILDEPEGKPEPWISDRRASGQLKWQFWERYQAYLKQDIPVPTLHQLDNLTNDILDRLIDPKTTGSWDRRGMAVGQVQSGKTSNYIGLINKAADAGYKLIIVLAGIHDTLRTQTQIRVDEGFLGYNTQSTMNFAKANNKIGVGKYNPNLAANALTTSHFDGDFKKQAAKSSGHNIKSTDPIVLVVKKNTSILKNLIQWLAAQGETKDNGKKLIENVPMLLIDDEADNASINVSKDSISATNGSIRALLSLFDQSAYVGYTATPFANIFIPISDKESVKGLNLSIKNFAFAVGEDLFPRDFIINIPAPSNYIGPAKVFGLPAVANSESGEEPLPIVVNLSDSNGFGNDYIPLIPDKHKKNDPLPAHLPESLTYAIKCFLLVCAARRARGQVNKHNSMLIHVSRYVIWQDRISKLTDETLKYYQRQIEFNQGTLWEELKSIWEKDFQSTTADVLRMTAENPNGFQDPNIVSLPWDIIATHLFPAVSKIEVRAVHGDKKVAGLSYHNISPLDYFQAEQEKPPRYLSIIAVGGDKLSRGLTLEGLSISYYLRASKMYDTLMQMGRWFGYRPGYVDLCRLFTSSELISWYKHITIASEEVREDFDRMFLLKQTPRQFGLKVRTHPGVLKITAINKFRYHRIERLSYSAELEQTHRFKVNESHFYNNLQGLQTLLTQLGEPGKASNTESQRKRHFVWQTDSLLVNQFLSAYRIGREVIDTAKLVDYIEKQTPKGSLVDWTVVLINNSSNSSRKEFFRINGQQTEVGLTRRGNAATDEPQVYSIAKAQLISPQDEFIDLTNEQQQTAQSETEEDWKKKERKGIPSYPSTFRIKYNRPANQGLLLIYPLDPEVEATTTINGTKTKTVQMLGTIPIVSFAVSFPNIEHDEKVEYAVNEQFIPDYDYDDLFDQVDNE